MDETNLTSFVVSPDKDSSHHLLNETMDAASPEVVAQQPVVAVKQVKKTLGFSIKAQPVAAVSSSSSSKPIVSKPTLSALAIAFSTPVAKPLTKMVKPQSKNETALLKEEDDEEEEDEEEKEDEDEGEDSQAVRPPSKKKKKKKPTENASSSLTAAAGGDDSVPKNEEKKKTKKANEKVDGDATETTKKKKTRKVKDPLAPKKAPSAYILFGKDNREALSKANPDADFSRMGKIIGDAWKALSHEESRVYKDKADELKRALPTAAVTAVSSSSSSSAIKSDSVIGEKKAVKILPPTVRKSLVLESSSGKPDTVSSSSSSSSVKKVKTKKDASSSSSSSSSSGTKRKRKSDDSDHDDKVDADDLILIRDPRADALMEAKARKEKGIASVIKGLVIEDAEGYDETLVLPKLTGKMDYSHALFSVNDDIALIIPCFTDWLIDLNSSTIPTHPLYIDKSQADVALSILASSGPDAAKALIPYHSWTLNGAIFGTVISITPLPTFAKSVAASLSKDDSANVADDDDKDDDKDGVSIIKAPSSGKKSHIQQQQQQVLLVTIALNELVTRAGGFHKIVDEKSDKDEEKEEEDKEATALVTLKDDEENDDIVIQPRSLRTKKNESSSSSRYASSSSSSSASASSLPLKTITIPWLPPSHPLIDSPFIITSDSYEASEGKSIRPGQQLRSMTVNAETSKGSGMRGEWNEGRCYNSCARRSEVALGWPRCLYKSVSVVWYNQDADTEAWFIDCRQEGNELSPWQVSTDKLPFVRVSDSFCQEVPALSSPKAVLDYVCSLEASGPFLKPVAKTETAYYGRIKQPIDLGTMTKRAVAGGKYEDGSESLWSDLRLLIFNAKLFNQPITSFFRMADMLEVEVRKLKKAYKGPSFPDKATTNNTATISSSSYSSSSSSSSLAQLQFVNSQVFDESEFEKIDVEKEMEDEENGEEKGEEETGEEEEEEKGEEKEEEEN
jgi:hypothetical protein